MRLRNTVYFCAISAILAGCGTKPVQPSDKHIQRQDSLPVTSPIPQPIRRAVTLPPPKPTPKAEIYSVVVTNVSAQEILFALARDAKINLDIHPGIQGTVTLNALNQTLPQILTRIARQVDMRYELDNGILTVMPDKPFLRTYKIDFVNMSRAVKSENSTSTQIAGTAGISSASTSVTSNTKNDLMQSLIDNVKAMLLDEDKLKYNEAIELAASNQARTEGTGTISTSSSLGGAVTNSDGATNISGPGSSASGSGNQSIQSGGAAIAKTGTYERAVNVFANNETGVLIVRATSRQHEKVQEFIDKVMAAAKRQVLIEATIVEVRLNDNYKQGINWSALRLGTRGVSLTQAGTAGLSSANPLNIFTIDYANPTSQGNFSAQISLLESFGTVKVLSSPKLSVMNNQTASLKVADNKIYFTVASTPAVYTSAGVMTSPTTYTTTPQTVSVGFIMNVTPQISDSDTVTINVRPTITRIVSFVKDPNPDLAKAGVVNEVPEIQIREMESIIKVDSGQIAVMGGLMQDEINNLTDAVPGISGIAFAGELFKHRNDKTTKTELVIFLRPVVIKDASLTGDFSAYRDILPDQNFLKEPAPAASPEKP
ncbi:MAG: pilus (MSHA type) biogenesis protein MshL [Gallionella sp.]|nr:pilus (MSHA type) biogenesis protein MshL [Gallionella sp.]